MAAQKTLRLQRRPPAVFPMEGKDALLSRPWKQRQSADEIVPERGGYTALPWQALAGYYMSLNCRPARQSAFLCKRIGFVMLSAGSTLGQNAEAALRPRPKPAPKSRMWKPHCGLSGLSSFGPRRGYVLRGEGDSDTTKT